MSYRRCSICNTNKTKIEHDGTIRDRQHWYHTTKSSTIQCRKCYRRAREKLTKHEKLHSKEYYLIHKEQINKRQRERYHKKKLLK
jgi:hypothetical protein